MASNNHYEPYSHGPQNPLRPYYIPPPPIPLDTSSSPAPVAAAPAPTPFAAPSSYAIIQDFKDYSEDYIDTPSVSEAMRSFLDQALTRYTSILIGQPFEVARTVLQCQYVPRKDGKGKHHHQPRGTATAEDEAADSEGDESKDEAEENPWTFEEEAEDSDDEPKYFASNDSPDESPLLQASKVAASPGPKKMTDRAGYVLEEKEAVPRPDYQIRKVASGAVTEAVKALWSKEGAWGVWKGTNTTFIRNVLISTVEAWSTSFLSAVLALPDPSVADISDSTNPLASLAIAISATAFTALLLAPLDVIRTKLILTPSSSKPRNLLACLRGLPSYFIPTSLIVPTTLHAVLPSFISLGTPYFLRAKLRVDPLLSPFSYNFLSLVSATAETFVRLPLETVLRRAQIAEANPERTIVPVGRYAGVVGTAWVLMKEEERGKWGFEGLYRGWRVVAWSNAGMLGLGLLGAQAGAHEF